MKECEECGEEINPKRVAAKPDAPLCIFCQQELEKNGGYALHKMDVRAKLKCGEVESTETTLYRGNG